MASPGRVLARMRAVIVIWSEVGDEREIVGGEVETERVTRAAREDNGERGLIISDRYC